MLIRWAADKEKELYGYAEFGRYDVLAAVDRIHEGYLESRESASGSYGRDNNKL
jgi:hypothetical protein